MPARSGVERATVSCARSTEDLRANVRSNEGNEGKCCFLGINGYLIETVHFKLVSVTLHISVPKNLGYTFSSHLPLSLVNGFAMIIWV